MYISDTKKFDFLNGEGIRMSIFVSGCSHYCDSCFNKKTWNPKFGKEFNNSLKEEIFEHFENNLMLLSGISILGGDPTYKTNIAPLTEFLKEFKSKFPTKTIWIWSGYTFDEIKESEKMFELIKLCDVLVDGKFELSKKNLDLKFRGSENQRVIDLKKSIKKNQIINYY
ncbi:MAG: anaerobic ribonucleoside-triphosphate reductase activating protein [Cetobacterium sp.]